MKKLTPNLADEQSAAFWRSVERSAAAIKDAPAWMRAGIDVNPRQFEAYEPAHEPPDTSVPVRRNRLVG